MPAFLAHSRRAFSLVELSIVLVILGLLTGGILSGQSLIRAAELRSVTTQYNQFFTAVRAFQDKYFALPGDMTNATKFWGSDTCPGTATYGVTVPHKETCDGDADKQITYNVNPNANEQYRFWQQLANAGLIEGSFTGMPSAGTVYNGVDDVTTNPANVPASRISGAHWGVTYVGVKPINSGYFDGSYGNVFYFNGGRSNGDTPVLKPEEAWNVDTKADDGKPGTGNITGIKFSTQANSATGCSDQDATNTVSIAASSNYLLSNKSIICQFVMKTGF